MSDEINLDEADGFQTFLKRALRQATLHVREHADIKPHALLITNPECPLNEQIGSRILYLPWPGNGEFDRNQQCAFSMTLREMCANIQAVGAVFITRSVKIINHLNLSQEDFFKAIEDERYPRQEIISAISQHRQIGHTLYEAEIVRNEENAVTEIRDWAILNDLGSPYTGIFSNFLLPHTPEEVIDYLRAMPTQKAQDSMKGIMCLDCDKNLADCKCLRPSPSRADVDLLFTKNGYPPPPRPTAKA